MKLTTRNNLFFSEIVFQLYKIHINFKKILYLLFYIPWYLALVMYILPETSRLLLFPDQVNYGYDSLYLNF